MRKSAMLPRRTALPRGIKKESLEMTTWLKDVAPSPGLRMWFKHDPVKWPEFQHRFFAELEKKLQAWRPIVDAACNGDVIFLFSSCDTRHNNAVALKAFLDSRIATATAA